MESVHIAEYTQIPCAVIGYGYWGRNVAQSLANSKHFKLAAIYDEDLQAQNEAYTRFHLTTLMNLEAILADCTIQAIFIITPPHTHYSLAKAALESRKHTFVEKPLATCLAHAQELYEIAQKQGVELYCDHIFLHSPAVEYLKNHIHSFGTIVSITARRINLGLFQSNVDVIWDLAIHDLSIIDYLVGLRIRHVSTFATSYLDYPNDALANINIELESGIIVMINVSWLSPIKVREMSIGGSLQSAIYDETKREKLTFFDSGVVIKDKLDKPSLYQKLVEYKLGSQHSPQLDSSLPLDNSIAYFAELIYARLGLCEALNSHKNDKNHVLRIIRAIEQIQSARL